MQPSDDAGQLGGMLVGAAIGFAGVLGYVLTIGQVNHSGIGVLVFAGVVGVVGMVVSLVSPHWQHLGRGIALGAVVPTAMFAVVGLLLAYALTEGLNGLSF